MTIKIDISIVESSKEEIANKLEEIVELLRKGVEQERGSYYNHQTLDLCSYDLKVRPIH